MLYLAFGVVVVLVFAAIAYPSHVLHIGIAGSALTGGLAVVHMARKSHSRQEAPRR